VPDGLLSPAFARAYINARMRQPDRPTIEVIVVVDGAGVIVAHGPPASWPPGVADGVMGGDLTVRHVRVQASRDVSDTAGGRRLAAEAPPVVPHRRASSLAERRSSTLGRLKAGVSSNPGGCSHMEDESLVHVATDVAFCCVYDGHGGVAAAQAPRRRRRRRCPPAPRPRPAPPHISARRSFAASASIST